MTDNSTPFAARSDVGKRREHNEDAYLAQLPALAVADGVGGSAKGEVASRTAVETLHLGTTAVATAVSSDAACREMESAILRANNAVYQAQLAQDEQHGMATTLTAAVLRDGGEVIVGHVGDSRLYVLSAAGPRLVTSDHSVVAELMRANKLTAEEAAQHPQRNVITRAIGPEPDLSIDTFVLHVGPGDWLLLCSDGLTEHVSDAELNEVVLKHGSKDPQASVDELIELANARGGTDNITVVVAQPVPSDVSGELTMITLNSPTSAQATDSETHALESAAQGAAPAPKARDFAPAEHSGPIAVVDLKAHDERELQPITPSDASFESRGANAQNTIGAQRRAQSSAWRTRIIIAVVALIAAVFGGFMWSQSYFLLERADGRVGVNQGFPFLRLATPYRTSDVAAAELSPSDRERLVNSHRIISREDADRILDDLPERVDDPIALGRG